MAARFPPRIANDGGLRTPRDVAYRCISNAGVPPYFCGRDRMGKPRGFLLSSARMLDSLHDILGPTSTDRWWRAFK